MSGWVLSVKYSYMRTRIQGIVYINIYTYINIHIHTLWSCLYGPKWPLLCFGTALKNTPETFWFKMRQKLHQRFRNYFKAWKHCLSVFPHNAKPESTDRPRSDFSSLFQRLLPICPVQHVLLIYLSIHTVPLCELWSMWLELEQWVGYWMHSYNQWTK